MSKRSPTTSQAIRHGFTRREIADRYLGPAIARLLRPLIARYPAKHHLEALATYLIEASPPTPADVIVVLGGGTLERAETGANLYRQGLAPVIFLSTDADPARDPAVGHQGDTSLRRLTALGVPATALLHDRLVQTTHDEARHFMAAAAEHRWGSALIVTEPFHLRRALGTFRQAAISLSVTVALRGIPAGTVPTVNWWKSPAWSAFVLNEYAGLLLYGAQGRLRLSSNH